jgi:23S rRNA (cytosine1962-C5)-methyltransferase
LKAKKVNMSIPILQLKKGKERSINNRHPWIFSGAVAKLPDEEEGTIVCVTDSDNKKLGFGFLSHKSQIVCRMFEWDDLSLFIKEEQYWISKIKNAFALRSTVIPFEKTNVYRLLHAEGDFFPGLIADVYGDVVVLQILIRGVERLIPVVIEALTQIGFQNIYVKAKTSSTVLEDIRTGSGWVKGGAELPVKVKENNVLFEVDFINGQKTGFFVDQRENRELLRTYSKDKKVLNTFCYTGGFSVYAAAGGASLVDSVDISKDAVEMASKNMELNYPETKHGAITADCFDFLGEIEKDHYDIIVLDPPAFAKSAKAVANACRGYKQINLKAFRKIKKGGLVFTYSCSQNIDKELFQKIVFGAAADAHRNIRIIHQMHQPADHPINIYHPEGEYLKGLVLYVE